MKTQITPQQFHATIIKGSTDATAKPYVSKQRPSFKQDANKLVALQASINRGI